MEKRFSDIIVCIRNMYPARSGVIPLHEPSFEGNEKKYLAECIDSTFVSYLGPFVEKFEALMTAYTGARHAIAAVNGTSALHAALMVAGVSSGDEVITQALTFVATANAVSYTGARCVFIDSDPGTLGMSSVALSAFLAEHTVMDAGVCRNRATGRRIAACVPMHVFGHPVKIEEIIEICARHRITVIEDAAESLGSWVQGKHTGRFGAAGILSFNGNKTITTGGGGMLITDDDAFAARARHLMTTAKEKHPYEFLHDQVGYNYRLPNVNAAVGCAQMEQLPSILRRKRALAESYRTFFAGIGIRFISEPPGCISNYWLNAICLEDRAERDAFIAYARAQGVHVRPVWRLMNELPMYRDCQTGPLPQAQWLQDRVVNLPSGVR